MQFRVPWADTDKAGIVHFASFLKWFEQAEIELFRESGKSRKQLNEESGTDQPRLSAKCDYFSPAYDDDLLEIRTTVANISDKTYRLRFEVHRSDDGVHLATGEVVACCIKVQEDGPLRSHPLPGEMVAALKRYLVSPENNDA
jgi:YbgC/YbaW family acyl-CoA thioester hydrolase